MRNTKCVYKGGTYILRIEKIELLILVKKQPFFSVKYFFKNDKQPKKTVGEYRMLAFDIGQKCSGYSVQKNDNFSNVLNIQNTKCVYMEKHILDM